MRPEEGEKGIQGLQYDWCQLVWAPIEFHLHQQHRPGFKRTVQIPKRNKNWIETHPWRNKTVQPLKLSWLFPHLVLLSVAWFPFTLCWWREHFPGDCHVERNSKKPHMHRTHSLRITKHLGQALLHGSYTYVPLWYYILWHYFKWALEFCSFNKCFDQAENSPATFLFGGKFTDFK